MKLKDFLKLCPDLSFTIHRNGQIDGHYLEAGDIENELLDLSVVEVAASYVPDLTDLFIWVADPSELDTEENDVNPRF